MPLIERDHMIEQITPHAAHPTFGHSVLPRATERGAQWLATHGLYDRSYISPELRIPVEEQETLRLLTRVRSLLIVR